ncbi:tRNA lysidine(34) synthetase TilS [Guggenheimella bovis]
MLELFQDLIEPNEKILLSFSGGVDSSVLLDLLLEYRKEVPFELELYHLNHKLRESAERDERFAIETAKKHQLVLHLESANVEEQAILWKQGIEETARKIRYEKAYDIMREESIQKLFLAHHENDQVETFFLNLFRGSGLSGLTGMKRVEGMKVRPLLNWTRERIEAYAKEKNIEYVFDETNLDNEYRRNELRNVIIPYLSEKFGANIEESVARTMSLLRSDEEHMERELESIEDKDSYDLTSLVALDDALLSRFIRRTLKTRKTLQNVTSEQILGLVRFLRSDHYGEVSIQGLTFSKEQGTLMIFDELREPLTVQEVVLGEQLIPNGKLFVEESNIKRGDLSIPKAMIQGKLRIRPRNMGDEIRLDETKHKNLKNWFIDEKIPRSLRDQIPLLTDDQTLYWIVGYRRAFLEEMNPPYLCFYFTKAKK